MRYLKHSCSRAFVGETARRQDGKTARRQDGKTARRQDSKTARQQDSKTARQQDSKTAGQQDSGIARHREILREYLQTGFIRKRNAWSGRQTTSSAERQLP
jgi:hypothetical protein